MTSKRRWVYRLKTTRKFDTQFKKLPQKDKALTLQLMQRLVSGEKLDERHKDHRLTGDLKAYRECHIRPNLLLIYEKQEDILLLTCINLGSHSRLFKK